MGRGSKSGQQPWRTHCRRGHPFNTKTTFVQTMPSGTKVQVCKVCRAVNKRASDARVRARKAASQTEVAPSATTQEVE